MYFFSISEAFVQCSLFIPICGLGIAPTSKGALKPYNAFEKTISLHKLKLGVLRIMDKHKICNMKSKHDIHTISHEFKFLSSNRLLFILIAICFPCIYYGCVMISYSGNLCFYKSISGYFVTSLKTLSAEATSFD